ncbi:MAG TPA: hypothetical protein VGV38_23870, partial [Pyrinomonadaceae bacterium]|nr:hypothetical protein [Pyrinomonadaceae bacterium]
MSLAFNLQTPAERAPDLRAALARELSRRSGAPRSIVRLERRPSPFCSSYALEELDAETDAGERLGLVFKNLSRAAMLEGARRAKPDFLYDP